MNASLKRNPKVSDPSLDLSHHSDNLAPYLDGTGASCTYPYFILIPAMVQKDAIITYGRVKRSKARGKPPGRLFCGYWCLFDIVPKLPSAPVESQRDDDCHDGDQDHEDDEQDGGDGPLGLLLFGSGLCGDFLLGSEELESDIEVT